MTKATDPKTAGALETLLTHDARFVRLVAEETEARLGLEGLTTVEEALHRYGGWLARSIHGRTSPGAPLRLRALLQSWDSGEVGGGRLTGWSAVLNDPQGVILLLTGSPALRHFEAHGVGPLGPWFYGHVFAGVSDEVGVDAPTVSAADGSIAVRWVLPCSEAPAPAPLPDDRSLLLHTTEGRGALMALVGQALLATHDATGELCLRTALARFGDVTPLNDLDQSCSPEFPTWGRWLA